MFSCIYVCTCAVSFQWVPGRGGSHKFGGAKCPANVHLKDPNVLVLSCPFSCTSKTLTVVCEASQRFSNILYRIVFEVVYSCVYGRGEKQNGLCIQTSEVFGEYLF